MDTAFSLLSVFVGKIVFFVTTVLTSFLPVSLGLKAYTWFSTLSYTLGQIFGYLYIFDFLVNVNLLLTLLGLAVVFQFFVWSVKMVILLFRFVVQLLISLAGLISIFI